MGALTSFPLEYLQDAIPAPRRVVVRTFKAGIASRVGLVTFKRSGEHTHHVRYTVRIQPKRFSELADHFTRVTRQIDWPVDEPDVE